MQMVAFRSASSNTNSTGATGQATTPTFIQTGAGNITSGSSVAANFPAANQAGNFIIAYVVWDNAGPVSLSDTNGNVYASAAGARQNSVDNASAQIFFAPNIHSGSNQVTAAFGTAVSSRAAIYIHEYSEFSSVHPLDGSAWAMGTAPAMTSGLLTTSSPNDLLFAAGESNNAVTAGAAGFTDRSNAFGNWTEDGNAAAIGAYSTTATQNGSAWIMQLVAFRATATTSTTPPVVIVPTAATPTFVQTAATQLASGNSVSVSFPAANQAGNFIIAYVVWDNAGPVSLSDTNGNVYASAAGARRNNVDNSSAQVFFAPNIRPVAPKLPPASAPRSLRRAAIYIHEYSGISATYPLDGSAWASGTAPSMTSGSLTTSGPNDLLFAAGESNNAVTAGGAGFTARSNAFGNFTEDGGAPVSGAYSTTATQNGTAWTMQLVAFRAVKSNTDTTPPGVPTGLAGTGVSTSQIDLTWNASADNVGVTGYKVFETELKSRPLHRAHRYWSADSCRPRPIRSR